MSYENQPQEQYIDDTSFSFWELEDNVEMDIKTPPQIQEIKERRSVEDVDTDGYTDYSGANDLFEQEEIDFYNEQAEAKEKEENEQENEIGTSLFEDIPDDAVISVGEHQISKSELASLVKARQDIDQSFQGLSNLSTALEEKEIQLNTFISSNMLECDQKIQEIKRRMNDPMTNPSQRGELYNHLQFYETRKSNIQGQAQQRERELYNGKLDIIKQRYNTLNREMSREMSDWAEQSVKVKDYALKSGISEQELHQVASPALVKLIMKSMKYDNTLTSSKDLLKDKIAPKQQRATTASRGKVADVSNKRNRILKEIEKGYVGDPMNWFDYLED